MPTNDAFDMAWAASKDEAVHKGIMDYLERIRDSHKKGVARRDDKRMQAMQRGMALTANMDANRQKLQEARDRGVDFDEVDGEDQLMNEVIAQIRGNTHNQVFADDDDGIQNSVDALPWKTRSPIHSAIPTPLQSKSLERMFQQNISLLLSKPSLLKKSRTLELM